MSPLTARHEGTSAERREPITAAMPGAGVVRVQWSDDLRFSSLSGVDEETLGILANAELSDRIQRRREIGMAGAVPIDEFIESLEG